MGTKVIVSVLSFSSYILVFEKWTEIKVDIKTAKSVNRKIYVKVKYGCPFLDASTYQVSLL